MIVISSDLPSGVVFNEKKASLSALLLVEFWSNDTSKVAVLVSTVETANVLATLCHSQNAALLFGRLLFWIA